MDQVNHSMFMSKAELVIRNSFIISINLDRRIPSNLDVMSSKLIGLFDLG